MSEKLYILDAHSLIYQVFHAIPEMTAPNGEPTNAIFGFVRDIQFLRTQKKPEYLVVAFDAPGVNFRSELFENYKSNRSSMPDDLRPQIEKIREILEAFRIPVLASPGVEADDYLATVGAACEQRGIRAFLCTADKDLRQAITDNVTLYDLRRNRIIDRQYVIEDWGVTPEQVIDYQAMVGDSVDCIPGIPGVGPKTASSLLQKYKNLETIFEHVDEVPGKKMKENLYKGRASAFLCRRLVQLKTDVPIPDDWTAWKLQKPDHAKLIDIFTKLGFQRLTSEIRSEVVKDEVWTAEYHPVTTVAGLTDAITKLRQQNRISVDLETTDLDPMRAKIVGVALALEPGQAYYLAVRGPAGETELDEATVLSALKPLLEDPTLEKVGQNLKYDQIVLEQAGVHLVGVEFDTLLASYLLEPGERNHNLDDLSQRLLDHETIKIESVIGKGKSAINMADAGVAKVAQYAGEDADVAFRLRNILSQKLVDEGLDRLYRDLELPLRDVLVAMQRTGFRINAGRLGDLRAEFDARLSAVREQTFALVGHEFNLDSPTQLRKVLFDELKLPIIKRTQSGPSTDQEVLDELSEMHPVCDLLNESRKITKLIGTYLEALPALINPMTGRVHASLNQAVATTGRLSSSDPNLQNIPVRSEEGKQIRQAFLPGRDDQVLLTADYSQIELRMLAHFSEDPNLQMAFREDQDIHAVVAAQIAGVTPDQVSPEQRRGAKAVNFGVMYGLSPFGLAKQLKISREEATAFIDAYFERHPGVEAFFREILEFARKNQYVTTILGRKRPINGVRNTQVRNRNLPARTAINTVVQGSAADLIKKAMIGIHRRLQTEGFGGARMLLQVHDELVFEVDRGAALSLAEMVNQEMTTAMTLKTPLKVDLAIGPNWLDVSPITVGGQ